MATKIVTKNSSTASAVPTASDLVQGELAVNVADKRLFTEDNAGAIVELGTNPSGNVTFQDNGKAIFGAGSDLQIYHDGDSSYISHNTTGTDLVVEATSPGDDVIVRAADDLNFRVNGNENGIVVVGGGATSLYHANSVKLSTTATGIDVTGTATMDALDLGATTDAAVVSTTASNYQLQLGAAQSTTGDIGRNISFDAAGTTTAAINSIDNGTSNSQSLGFFTGNSTSLNQRLNIASNGDISFYEDTGTTPKLFWDASAESLGIGTSSPDAPLDIKLNTNSTADIFKFQRNDGAVAGVLNYSGTDGAISLGTTTSHDFTFDTAGSERMRIDASGNVGIGTSSPDTGLDVATTNYTFAGTTYDIYGLFGDTSGGIRLGADSSNDDSVIGTTGTNALQFVTYNGSSWGSRMTLSNTGNVGIGTSSPAQALQVNGRIRVSTDGSNGGDLGVDASGLAFSTIGSTQPILFERNNYTAESMRIDSSGNLLVGTTNYAPVSNNVVGISARGQYGELQVSTEGSTGAPLYLNRKTSDGDIAVFRKDGSTVGSIGTEGGRLQIGKGASGIYFYDSGPSVLPWNIGSNTSADNSIDLGSSGGRFKSLYLSGDVVLGASDGYIFGNTNGVNIRASSGKSTIFDTAGSERMRIDSSGNLLVGTTDTSLYNNTSGGGFHASQSGYTEVAYESANAADPSFIINNTGVDGDILQFRKDGTSVGSIGTNGGDLYIGTGDTVLAFLDGGDFIAPWNTSTNAYRDNAVDLGTTSGRFDDIYATNGTIQTSDRNEKQDIEALSDAEQRVAVACKGLLRKFRWKDSVAEKGDEARTHFGIIAQDLQAAFAAEGLDAGDYAMFISTTWTDEETNEEKTRMGVRYSELLAFIISAI